VPDESVDVVVYGGTPAGLIAAVAAARLGASTLVLEQTEHVGGLSTSGLVTAESEHMLLASFSGLALEFYQRLGRAYGHAGPLFYWESRLAEEVFADMVAEAGVPVRFGQLLAQVETRAGRVQRMVLTDGSTVAGRVFIDASYEGDLMAGAGVAYTVGREPSEQYGESLAGIRFVERPEQVASFVGEVTTDRPVDVCPYDDAGGLLPGVVAADGLVPGAGDRKPMAYNFRVTVSNGPDRVPIQAPPGYDPPRFTLLGRYLRLRPETRLGELLAFSPFPSGRYQLQADGRTRALPGSKWELNNRQDAVISLGHLGGQFAYPEADHAQRRAIWPRIRDGPAAPYNRTVNRPERTGPASKVAGRTGGAD
jgi:flavin-dependent dehydrogenase